MSEAEKKEEEGKRATLLLDCALFGVVVECRLEPEAGKLDKISEFSCA